MNDNVGRDRPVVTEEMIIKGLEVFWAWKTESDFVSERFLVISMYEAMQGAATVS